METKTWLEIANEIKNDSDINFIGRAISPLHILGIEAYILYLKESGVPVKGYILAVPHFDTGMMLDENLFHQDLYDNVRPVYLNGDNDLKTDFTNLLHATGRKDCNSSF